MRHGASWVICGVAFGLLVIGPAAWAQDGSGEGGDTPESGEAPAEGEATGESSEAPATTAPATAPAAEPGPAAADLQTSEQAYNLKIKNLEEKVNRLKEKIFRSKARLMLLRETVLTGVISGAKARLWHRNEMGSSFKLLAASYYLDGAPIFKKVDTDGSLDAEEEFEIYSGNVVPGPHLISVQLQYRGHGFGIFSYLEGYKFKIKSSYSFNAEEGKVTDIKVVGFEKGGLTEDLKDRPAVRYDVKIKRDSTADKLQIKAGEGGEGNAAE